MADTTDPGQFAFMCEHPTTVHTHRQTHACSIDIVNIHSSDRVAGARFVCLGSVAGVEPNVSIVKMGAGGVKRDHQ